MPLCKCSIAPLTSRYLHRVPLQSAIVYHDRKKSNKESKRYTYHQTKRSPQSIGRNSYRLHANPKDAFDPPPVCVSKFYSIDGAPADHSNKDEGPGTSDDETDGEDPKSLSWQDEFANAASCRRRRRRCNGFLLVCEDSVDEGSLFCR